MIPAEDIANRFKYHPATSQNTQDAHTAVRQRCQAMADWANVVLPDGREKSLVVTHLEEVMFWANAAIARQGS